MGEHLLSVMRSKFQEVNQFNKREAIRAKIGQIILGILMTIFVIEEVKAIFTPVVYTYAGNPQPYQTLMQVEAEKPSQEVADSGNALTVASVTTREDDSQDDSSQRRIKKVAEERGFHNVQGLLNLAHCESRFNRWAFNPTNNSNDRGVFQISKRWHPTVTDEQAYNIEWATNWTIDKIEKGGLDMWMCAHAYRDNNYLASI